MKKIELWQDTKPELFEEIAFVWKSKLLQKYK